MIDSWICVCGEETTETHWHYDEDGKAFHIAPNDLLLGPHHFNCRCALIPFSDNDVSKND